MKTQVGLLPLEKVLVPLPPGKKTVGCRWVYAVKAGPNGEVDRLKAHYMALTIRILFLLWPKSLLIVSFLQ